MCKVYQEAPQAMGPTALQNSPRNPRADLFDEALGASLVARRNLQAAGESRQK
jgi:hypothetical protein